MLKIVPFIFLTLAADPAFAGATAWQELSPGVNARIVSTDALDADGRLLAGLELDMPKSTMTYWRIPGETGIPAQFDFAGSTGLGEAEVIWPYPEIDRSQGYLDYVFHGHLVLPIRLKVTDSNNAVLSLSATLGVCSDICVPAQADFSLPIAFGKPDDVEATRLAIALQATPDVWTAAGEPFGRVTATPEGLAIAGMDPTIDPDSIIADLDDPALVFETPQKSPDGTAWLLELLGGMGNEGLQGRTVRLTFMAGHIPYSVSRPIEPAS